MQILQPLNSLENIYLEYPLFPTGSKCSLEGSTGYILKTVDFQVKVHVNFQWGPGQLPPPRGQHIHQLMTNRSLGQKCRPDPQPLAKFTCLQASLIEIKPQCSKTTRSPLNIQERRGSKGLFSPHLPTRTLTLSIYILLLRAQLGDRMLSPWRKHIFIPQWPPHYVNDCTYLIYVYRLYSLRLSVKLPIGNRSFQYSHLCLTRKQWIQIRSWAQDEDDPL